MNLRCLMLLGVVMVGTSSLRADDGFVSIFDGRSLEGWVGQDMSFWSIEEGAITGTISPTHRPPMNQYLVWQGGLVEDFELKLDYRHTGSTTPDTNGGFQYRSRRLPNGDVGGYQVDNNFGQPWRARLYDEFGRHDLALEGEEAWFSPVGIRRVEKKDFGHGPVNFRLDEWHEYHLTAIGKDLKLRVNGEVIAVVHDGDDDSFEPRGVLAMQLHTGPTMKAQFKNIRLKTIRVAPTYTRDSIFAHASLHWDMGDRANAHQPPLAAVGKVHLIAGDGERVAHLSSGYFHAQVDLNTPKAWNVPGNALTSHVRGSINPTTPSVVLWSKGKSGDQLHFCWSAERVNGERVGRFSIRTKEGLFTVEGDAGTDGDIHDWIARYTGESLELWTDGTKVASVPARGDLLGSDSPILIGTATDANEPTGNFTGVLIEVSLWNESLTDAQITMLAN